MIEIAQREGDKATEEIAKLMLTIKSVAKERNKADFGKKFMDTSSDIIKRLTIAKWCFRRCFRWCY